MTLYWMTFAATSVAVVTCVALLLQGAASARGNLVLAIGACVVFAFGTVLAWPVHGARLALWLAAVLPAGQGVGRVASVNGMLLIAVVAWATMLFAVGVLLATLKAGPTVAVVQGWGADGLRTMRPGPVPLAGPELAPVKPWHGSNLRGLRLVHSSASRDGSERRPRGP